MTILRTLLLFTTLVLCFHLLEASNNNNEDDIEYSAFALDVVNLSAAHNNFQQWLSHIRRTTTHHHHQGGKNHSQTVDHVAFNASASAKGQMEMTLDENDDQVCQKRMILVEKDGSGDFTSVQAAIDSVPRRNKCRVIIVIGAGIFREKVTIRRSKPHITLSGGNPHQRTIIVWNDTASSQDEKGQLLRTIHSASVAINSNYFIAKNITFMNSTPAQKRGVVAQQAVALRISGDKAAFFNCQFYAHQDTLYDHRGRHYFKNCYITGTVDFIFGNGKSFYEGAQLVALDDHYGIPGTITAQKRNMTTPDTGFSFVNSRITGAGMVYLGRAWDDDSRVVFSNSFMDKIVVPEGWGNWGVPAREKTVFYAQFNCTGPGADTSHRVNWSHTLTAAEAAPFLTPSFINGEKWLEGYKK